MRLVFLGILLLPLMVYGQKKRIDHTVYDSWNELTGESASNDGKYITYQIRPQVGDGWLYLYNVGEASKDSIFKGHNAKFGPESNYLAAKIDPGYDTIRTLKLKGAKPHKLPNDTGIVRILDRDTTLVFPNTAYYSIPEEGNFLVLRSKESTYEPPKPKKKCKLFFWKKDKDPPKIKTKGKDIVLINTKTLGVDTIQNVRDYDLSENGKWLSVIRHWKVDTLDSFHVEIRNLESGNISTVLSGFHQSLEDLSTSYNGTYTAFLVSDDTAENKVHSLYLRRPGDSIAKRIVDTSSIGIPEGMTPTDYGSLTFSENEKKLYFGISQKPYNEPEDTLLDSEEFSVDIWHWKDKELQPQQLKSQSRDRRKSFSCVYHLQEKEFVQLEDEEMPSIIVSYDKGHNLAIGRSTLPYQRTYSWTMPWPSDYYLVDEKTGNRKLLMEGLGSFVYLSPKGNNAIYYVNEDSAWYKIDLKEGAIECISHAINDELARDNNGSPYVPGSHGIAGWNEDNSVVLINSEYNVWHIDLNGDNDHCMTCGIDSNMVFRLLDWDEEKRYIDLDEDLYFRMFNKENKRTGLGVKQKNTDEIIEVFMGDLALYRGIEKAKDAPLFLFRPMSFEEYPDLWIWEAGSWLNGENTEPELKQITNTNPQQEEYNWGTVEMVDWKSFEGIELDGLLYKPEDFDPSKKYPMIVYFYERYDDMLHRHYVPKPTASIVYPTEYVSNGYIIFIPNIEYTPGHPGKSAYDCIVSGTDYLLDKYNWIDSTKLGLQGQSWGGYQTAYLVTQTDKYAAAMAGAPVSNMTSAYGGIRWGSGMSRMFQYERTQSRIGYTLWDSLDLYIENSPIFFAPNVNTPLLIMHNDDDGAVPWYQGIEYFVALRRLNKPVWLLNYNDDQHNLMKRANRKDLSIRMRQFFDHYLKDAPPPEWLKKGLPAVDKGRKTGYELIEE